MTDFININTLVSCAVLCLVAQLCLTLCNPMDCSLPGSCVHGDSPSKNTGMGCHGLLQGIFPTQGSNPCVHHCRRIPPGKPKNTGVGILSLLQGILQNQDCIRWPKYWSFSFNISPSNEHPGLISFRMDWLDLLTVQGTLKRLLQHHSSKASILQCSAFSQSNSHIHT